MKQSVTPLPQGENPGKELDKHNRTADLKKTSINTTYISFIKSCNTADWRGVLSAYPEMRTKLMFVAMKLLNKRSIRGEGFNSYDQFRATSDCLPGGLLSMGAYDCLQWARRLVKYRRQLSECGIDYPRNIFMEELLCRT